MAITCKACGAQNMDSATFCNLCGDPIRENQAASAAPQPGAFATAPVGSPYAAPAANPYESRPMYYSNDTSSGSGATGWGTAAFAAVGLLGFFLPLVSTPFGRSGSLFDLAKDVKFIWIFPLALLAAGLIGVSLAMGNLSQRGGWCALSGVLAGISGTLSIVFVYSAVLGDGFGSTGIGFWCTVIGSIGAVIAAVVAAFKESA